MNIQAIQAKAAKGEQLTDEELKFLGTGWSLDDAISKARKDAQDKAAKDAAALQVALDEAREALDAKDTAGATELEKARLQAEKANKKAEALQKQVEDQAAAVAKASRDAQIDAIASGIQWVNPNASKAGRVLLERELSALTDLTDEATVTPLVDAAKATSLTLLMAAEGTTGAGVHSSTGNAGAKGGKEPIRFSPDMFKGKTPEERERLMADMASQPDPELQKVAVGDRTVMRATV